MTTIRTVEQDERSWATSTLLLAFAADPIMRWLWPEPHAYLEHFPELLRAFGGRAFDNRSADASADFRGAALWLPPGVGPDDEALETLARDRVAEGIRSELDEIFELMSQAVPAAPHWHLAFVGVDPFSHGQGIGAALVTHALRRVDESGAEAYLESTNPRNISLYERHGFEVSGEIRVGAAPPMYPMVRPSH
jgi:ribosomal protein S18 acetylase RimI-like enzyme